LTSNDIQRYSKKSISQLIKIADVHFKKYIRERDEGMNCISCNSKGNQAGHYFSAGHYPELRYSTDNVNLQCTKCNLYLHGNLIEYRKGLIKKIGLERLERLEIVVGSFKQKLFKWDRLSLIETILKYQSKR